MERNVAININTDSIDEAIKRLERLIELSEKVEQPTYDVEKFFEIANRSLPFGSKPFKPDGERFIELLLCVIVEGLNQSLLG